MKHAGTLAALAICGFMAAAPTAAFADLYVFGDSLSDNGNVYATTLGLVPSPSEYFDGRFSNGPVWVEKLGFNLGLSPNLGSLVPAPSGTTTGYDFAHGGAASGNYFLLPAGLRINHQASAFADFVGAGDITLQAADVATFWGGANDYLLYGQDASDASSVVDNLMSGLNDIVATGVDNIIVLNLPDLGKTPGAIEDGSAATMSAASVQHNALFGAAVADLKQSSGANILYVDAFKIFNVIMSKPALFGFSNVGPTATSTGYCTGDGLLLSACPSTYLFYDTVHPTAHGHALIARIVSLLWRQQGSGAALTTSLGSTLQWMSAGQTAAINARLAARASGSPGFSNEREAFALLSSNGSARPLTLYVHQIGMAPSDNTWLVSTGPVTPSVPAANEQRTLTVGSDIEITGRWVIGTAISRAEIANSSLASLTDFDTRSVGAFAYAARRGDRTTFAVMGGMTEHSFETNRFTGLAEFPSARAESVAHSTWLRLQGSMTRQLPLGLQAELETNLYYSRLSFGALSEDGTAGLLDLVLPAQRSESLLGFTGVRLEAARGSFGLSARLGHAWTLAGDPGISPAYMGDDISTRTAPFARDASVFDLGVTLPSVAGVDFGARYAALLMDGEAHQYASMRASLRFW